jgi:hypothetical protein
VTLLYALSLIPRSGRGTRPKFRWPQTRRWFAACGPQGGTLVGSPSSGLVNHSTRHGQVHAGATLCLTRAGSGSSTTLGGPCLVRSRGFRRLPCSIPNPFGPVRDSVRAWSRRGVPSFQRPRMPAPKRRILPKFIRLDTLYLGQGFHRAGAIYAPAMSFSTRCRGKHGAALHGPSLPTADGRITRGGGGGGGRSLRNGDPFGQVSKAFRVDATLPATPKIDRATQAVPRQLHDLGLEENATLEVSPDTTGKTRWQSKGTSSRVRGPQGHQILARSCGETRFRERSRLRSGSGSPITVRSRPVLRHRHCMVFFCGRRRAPSVQRGATNDPRPTTTAFFHPVNDSHWHGPSWDRNKRCQGLLRPAHQAPVPERSRNRPHLIAPTDQQRVLVPAPGAMPCNTTSERGGIETRARSNPGTGVRSRSRSILAQRCILDSISKS